MYTVKGGRVTVSLLQSLVSVSSMGGWDIITNRRNAPGERSMES